MNQKQNLLLVFVAATVVGAIFWAIGGRGGLTSTPQVEPAMIIDKVSTRACPFCAEQIKPQAILCRFCGRDVPPLVVAVEDPVRPVPTNDPAVTPTSKVDLDGMRSKVKAIIPPVPSHEPIATPLPTVDLDGMWNKLKAIFSLGR